GLCAPFGYFEHPITHSMHTRISSNCLRNILWHSIAAVTACAFGRRVWSGRGIFPRRGEWRRKAGEDEQKVDWAVRDMAEEDFDEPEDGEHRGEQEEEHWFVVRLEQKQIHSGA